MAKKGFTLAEVLIALGIIGVVAALIMPFLITKYQKRATVERLKSTYAIFQQAIKRSIAENGDVSFWSFPDPNNAIQQEYYDFTDTYLAPYLNIIKKYRRYEYEGPYSLSKIKTGFFMGGAHLPYQLNNGVIFSFFGAGYRYFIWVDLNGNKQPNMVGRDVFIFAFNKNTSELEMEGKHCARENLIPGRQAHCIDGDFVIYYYDSICNYKDGNRYAGASCGSIIERDGWKISDDYPW